MQNRKTDAETRALKLATIYAVMCGANVPTSVLHAAVRNGTIASTPKGRIVKQSFARFLEREGYFKSAASFRCQFGLTERAAGKIEYRSFLQ